eukprot:2278909-Pyramimonas_sp.AAC.1
MLRAQGAQVPLFVSRHLPVVLLPLYRRKVAAARRLAQAAEGRLPVVDVAPARSHCVPVPDVADDLLLERAARRPHLLRHLLRLQGGRGQPA